MPLGSAPCHQRQKKSERIKEKQVLKDFLTKNIWLKTLALILAMILWVIARFWAVKV